MEAHSKKGCPWLRIGIEIVQCGPVWQTMTVEYCTTKVYFTATCKMAYHDKVYRALFPQRALYGVYGTLVCIIEPSILSPAPFIVTGQNMYLTRMVNFIPFTRYLKKYILYFKNLIAEICIRSFPSNPSIGACQYYSPLQMSLNWIIFSHYRYPW